METDKRKAPSKIRLAVEFMEEALKKKGVIPEPPLYRYVVVYTVTVVAAVFLAVPLTLYIITTNAYGLLTHRPNYHT